MTNSGGFGCLKEKLLRVCFGVGVAPGFEIDAQDGTLGHRVVWIRSQPSAQEFEGFVVVTSLEFVEARDVDYLRGSAKRDSQEEYPRKGAKAQSQDLRFPEGLNFASLRLCASNLFHFLRPCLLDRSIHLRQLDK